MDIYTTTLGDTWDKIAFKVYGEEKYMHELMEANPDMIKTIFFEANIRVICPDIPIPLNAKLPPWKRGV